MRHRVFSDRASGHGLPLQYYSLGGLPPYCQFTFKTLTGLLDSIVSFSLPDPLPVQDCLVRRADFSRLSRSGCVGCLVLGKVSQAWGLTCRLHPGKPSPPSKGIRAARRAAVRDIAGYYPFRCQFQHECAAKTSRRASCSFVPHAPGTVPQDVVEIDSGPEPLPQGLRWVRLEHHPCLSAYQRHSTAYLG